MDRRRQKQDMASVPAYTVGARVHNGSDPHLHVTLGYVGECDDARLKQVEDAMRARAHLPIRFTLGEEALFGPKQTVPVRKCEFVDPDAAAAWRSFYQEFALQEPNLPGPRPDVQTYHITMKTAATEEFRTKTSIFCTHVFLKQLGPHDPVATCTLYSDARTPAWPKQHSL
jgi:2'-5' RNA ligase